MAWQKGDLGRFKYESAAAPRFEVLGMRKDRQFIRVWYGGEPHPKDIPFNVFKNDCVSWWTMPIDPVPVSWLREGVKFSFEGLVTTAEIPFRLDSPSAHHPLGYQRSNKDVMIQHSEKVKEEMLVRSIRKGFVSCFAELSKTLRILPFDQIAKGGSALVSAWDLIAADNDPLDETDEDLVDVLRHA